MNKNLKVLILEEDVLNMRLFKDLFGLRGLRTICITDRERFLEYVLENMPNFVLFDVGEEIVNVKAIRALKRNKKIRHIPVVALTAFMQREYHRKILRIGCDYLLIKPFPMERLVAVIKSFIPLETYVDELS